MEERATLDNRNILARCLLVRRLYGDGKLDVPP